MKAKTTNDAAFRALSHPARRAMLDLMAESERAVNDLVGRFNMTQPAVSQHLRALEMAGLVTCRRNGRERLYRVNAQQLKPVADWVGHYERFWKGKLKKLGDFLEKEDK